MTNAMTIEQELKQAGIVNSVQEANWIIKYGKGDLNDIVLRRIHGEPLQYLLGEWEFYGYPFKVGKGVLIPRPETELLVDIAKEHNPKRVYDLCAGSGCVGIALAREIGCNVIAVEKSPQAFEYLKQNIKLNHVETRVMPIQADVLNPELSTIIDRQSSILINPPYLSKTEMSNLQKEVAHEPESALFGGEDGLEFYREFFKKWKKRINLCGLFACEIGDAQAAAVCDLLEETGNSPQVKKDFNGINRVVLTRRKE